MHRLAFILTAAAAILAQHARAATYYVAANGNGTNPGTEAKPFATPAQARDAIRRLKASGPLPAGGVTVELRGGCYELSRALELMAQDSGTENAPVVYRAHPGEEARLIGGRVVTGWKPVADPAISIRLDATARGKVWQADLRALGITDLGEVAAGDNRLELFFHDRPMTLARWPNDGFVKIVDLLGPTKVDVRGTRDAGIGKFAYHGDRPKRWAGDRDIWLHGYWFWDWADQRQQVESIDADEAYDRRSRPITATATARGSGTTPSTCCSELDEPGEWYLDRQSGHPLFLAAGTAGQRQGRGLARRHAGDHEEDLVRDAPRPDLEACARTAIAISGGDHNRIVGLHDPEHGRLAVSISGSQTAAWWAATSTRRATAASALGGGDRATLTPGRARTPTTTTSITTAAGSRMYHPAIHFDGVGNRATHNLIDNAPHMAIGFGGNDHLIEFNEIHSVCYESNDAGAIYAGRDWTMRGTVIRYNYLHHISGFEGRGCVGVYSDDQFSGTEIAATSSTR